MTHTRYTAGSRTERPNDTPPLTYQAANMIEVKIRNEHKMIVITRHADDLSAQMQRDYYRSVGYSEIK